MQSTGVTTEDLEDLQTAWLATRPGSRCALVKGPGRSSWRSPRSGTR
jgi:hypothetical protein